MAGWGRCNFWKASGISGLAKRDMLTIGGWVAVRRQMSPNQRPANFRFRPKADLGAEGKYSLHRPSLEK